jgi:hypothetical protein
MIPDHAGRIVAVFHHDYARAFTLTSDDEGATWSTPVEITEVFEQFRSDYPWQVCANGCGRGLQLRNGRMIVPVWLSDGSGTEFGRDLRGHRPSIVSLIYSDDGGQTWPIAKMLEQGPSGYSARAVLPDGVILCLYECDILTRMGDDRYLRLARFDMEWFSADQNGVISI